MTGRGAMSRLLLLAWVAALLLSGCGSQPEDCASPDVYCVGLVTDFGTVDAGINQQAWLGLQDARAARLADRIDAIETVDTRDRLANIQALAGDGYDLIVTVGSAIAEETAKAAALHPKQQFIGVEQPQQKKLKNLAGLVFREDYGGFLAGALAARMSETGKVAAVCEAQFVDPIRRYCEGFVAGAQYLDPEIEVTATYREGSNQRLFNDPAWGRNTAVQQVAQGADVIFAAGGRTADAALEAASAQGAYVIGSETDLYLDLPDIRPRLLSSATNDIRTSLVQIITLTRRGKFPAGQFMGSVKLAPWHDFDRQIPLETKQELERLFLSLQLEAIHLDIPYQNPQ
jgi:basic membrane protein A and related proteins